MRNIGIERGRRPAVIHIGPMQRTAVIVEERRSRFLVCGNVLRDSPRLAYVIIVFLIQLPVLVAGIFLISRHGQVASDPP